MGRWPGNLQKVEGTSAAAGTGKAKTDARLPQQNLLRELAPFSLHVFVALQCTPTPHRLEARLRGAIGSFGIFRASSVRGSRDGAPPAGRPADRLSPGLQRGAEPRPAARSPGRGGSLVRGEALRGGEGGPTALAEMIGYARDGDTVVVSPMELADVEQRLQSQGFSAEARPVSMADRCAALPRSDRRQPEWPAPCQRKAALGLRGEPNSTGFR
jgi:hypothetical protein